MLNGASDDKLIIFSYSCHHPHRTENIVLMIAVMTIMVFGHSRNSRAISPLTWNKEVISPPTVGAVAKIKVIPEKELISISDQKDGSFSKTSRSKTGQGKAALGRVKHIESSMSIQDRLERLETNVASVKQQRESVRKTNVLLGQVLTELRRINAALKQEESIQGVHTVHAQHPDSVSCSPTNQEFIIVEAYADHL